MSVDAVSVEQSERRWAFAMVGVTVVLLAAIVYATLGLHLAPPTNIETVDPSTIHISGEFVEENLGTRLDAKGGLTVRMVTTQFAFAPACVVVPQDTPVTFRVVSPDVVHGLMVVGTNINSMVIPGYISRVRTRFSEVGEMLMPCHEFCGIGHSQMLAKVRVVPMSDFKLDENGRASCEER